MHFCITFIGFCETHIRTRIHRIHIYIYIYTHTQVHKHAQIFHKSDGCASTVYAMLGCTRKAILACLVHVMLCCTRKTISTYLKIKLSGKTMQTTHSLCPEPLNPREDLLEDIGNGAQERPVRCEQQIACNVLQTLQPPGGCNCLYNHDFI